MTTSEKVKPWEKDILAQDSMQIPKDEMFQYSDDHIYFSKEASTGGNGVGGNDETSENTSSALRS